jgi:hypothetical protein
MIHEGKEHGLPFIECGLPPEAAEVHRALASLQEELEAIDAYHQRAEVCEDAALKEVLRHNRDDEMEHAAMLLEWLRRAFPTLDSQLRAFLFQPGARPGPPQGSGEGVAPGRGLGLGNLGDHLPKEKRS